MKVVILAGGKGSRLAEETTLRPKPMVEIGGRPILWHIMKIYSAYGLNEFIVCCGYKGYLIKEYFCNYSMYMSDVSIDFHRNSIEFINNTSEPWKVTLIDTGESTQTGGRLKRVRSYLEDESFCFTYGDGVSDIDISDLVKFHKAQGKLATLAAVRPSGRFGILGIENDKVSSFKEKFIDGEGWVNGGFYVLEPSIFDYIQGDDTVWEHYPVEELSRGGHLGAYKHYGMWEAMDTIRDKEHLQSLWEQGAFKWLKSE